MNRTEINKRVIVTSLGFRKNLAAYPRRIEFRGVTYSFIDAGLRCLIRNNDKSSEIITLSDGEKSFRMRREFPGSVWTLLSIAS